MKMHRLLAEAVVMAVYEVFNENRQADKVIERLLKQHKKWGARDRGFVAEHTYEVVRWWRYLLWVSDCEGRTDKSAIWHALAALLISKNAELPDWSDFRQVNGQAIQRKLRQTDVERRIRQSVPDWLDALGEAELGEQWTGELTALNIPAPVVIRANTLKTSRQQLASNLDQGGIETVNPPGLPDALELRRRTNLFSLPEFKQGLFEVQDGSSQHVGPFLQVEPGMRVVDACAGAGGKTLHLAALMQNKGRIISMDTEQWKLDELMRRARRAGASNIETRLIDSTKTIKRLKESADRLLLDVPCSGLGVLRRNPDAKWKLQPEFITRIRETQKQILSDYATMVKKGGMMVYATCSILPSEDERQVEIFLQSNPGFELREERRLSATLGFDGFYMALLYKQ